MLFADYLTNKMALLGDTGALSANISIFETGSRRTSRERLAWI